MMLLFRLIAFQIQRNSTFRGSNQRLEFPDPGKPETICNF